MSSRLNQTETWNLRNSTMADSSGASGILGVLIGVMLVVFIGVGVLMYSGKFGPAPQNITIKMPSGN